MCTSFPVGVKKQVLVCLKRNSISYATSSGIRFHTRAFINQLLLETRYVLSSSSSKITPASGTRCGLKDNLATTYSVLSVPFAILVFHDCLSCQLYHIALSTKSQQCPTCSPLLPRKNPTKWRLHFCNGALVL